MAEKRQGFSTAKSLFLVLIPMNRPPTDFAILREIYDRYYSTFCEYSRDTPTRSAKVMIPINVVDIAKKFRTDPDVIFGRLYFHLEPKYGFEKKDGTKVAFFALKAGDDKHCINFPLMTSHMAALWEERKRHFTSRYLAIAALVISAVTFTLTVVRDSRSAAVPEAAHAVVTPTAGVAAAPSVDTAHP